MSNKIGWLAGLALVAAGLSLVQAKKSKDKPKKEVWTDPADPTLPADFKFQGEYVSASARGGTRLPGDRAGQGHLPGGRLPRRPARRGLGRQEQDPHRRQARRRQGDVQPRNKDGKRALQVRRAGQFSATTPSSRRPARRTIPARSAARP